MQKQQIISITDKSKLEINLVDAILIFDDDYLKIQTETGVIEATGNGLKVESLIKETGQITVIGDISGVGFIEKKKRK